MAASEDEQDETKNGIPIEQTLSLNDLFSIILATRQNGHVAAQKLK